MIEHRDQYFCSTYTRRALEIGSGLGLNGILAHLLLTDPKCTVLLTDGDSEALVHLRRNIERNRSKLCSSVSGQQLLWGDGSSKEFLKRNDGAKFDIILASDIIYVKSIDFIYFQTLISR